MIVAFQSLEATLKSELTLLMNNQVGTPSGALVYATVAELSFGTSVRIANALPGIFTLERIAAKDEKSRARLSQSLRETADQLKTGLKLATEVEERRNQIVHSHWFIGPGYVAPEGTMSRMKTKTRKGNVSIDFEHESLADITHISDQASEAQRLVGMALRDYRNILMFDW